MPLPPAVCCLLSAVSPRPPRSWQGSRRAKQPPTAETALRAASQSCAEGLLCVCGALEAAVARAEGLLLRRVWRRGAARAAGAGRLWAAKGAAGPRTEAERGVGTGAKRLVKFCAFPGAASVRRQTN